jgi:hypothetical protein
MSCIAPDSVRQMAEAPQCAGPQVGGPVERRQWSCPYCSRVRGGVVSLSARNTQRVKQVAELSRLARVHGVTAKDQGVGLTGARLQREICDLVEGTLVDVFNDCLNGKAPTAYAFMVCGSLARREASAFSDIDALLVLPNDDPATLDFYRLAMKQMGDRLYNADGYITGFRFCPGGLSPDILMGTPDRIFDLIDKDGGAHLRGAYSPRFAFGAKPLAQDYIERCKDRVGGTGKADTRTALRLLESYLAKKRTYWMDDEQEGWMPPPRDPVAVQVKCQFYRPVTMVVEALAMYYGAPGSSSRERVISLIKAEHMSVEVGNFIFNILDDMAKIRTEAHVKAGREFEGVRLRATRQLDMKPQWKGVLEDLKEVPMADRASAAIALALTERMGRFWTMTDKFVREKSKKIALSRDNPFKSTRP